MAGLPALGSPAMRFLISVMDTSTGSATSEEMAAIDVFNDRLVADGHWVLACGLAAPATALVIDGRTPEPFVTEGPLIRTADYVSGFWIVEAADHETARALAVDGSRACNRLVELRPLLG
jgi:hypothetical protein